jgi:hypothetical protein
MSTTSTNTSKPKDKAKDFRGRKATSPEERMRGAQARGLDPAKGSTENRIRSLPPNVR